MASVKLSGDSSGVITLAAPAAAGTNTITMPASTGTMALTSDIPASGGVTYLGTMTTTSGTTQTITGLDFTDLNFLIFVVAQVSHSDTGGSRKLQIGIAGNADFAVGDPVANGNCSIGQLIFDLRSNIGHFPQSPGNTPITSGSDFVGGGTGHLRYNIGTNLRSSSSTSVSCSWESSATFDNGKIEVYGCK